VLPVSGAFPTNRPVSAARSRGQPYEKARQCCPFQGPALQRGPSVLPVSEAYPATRPVSAARFRCLPVPASPSRPQPVRAGPSRSPAGPCRSQPVPAGLQPYPAGNPRITPAATTRLHQKLNLLSFISTPSSLPPPLCASTLPVIQLFHGLTRGRRRCDSALTWPNLRTAEL
jgi:hypothetical protein